MKKLMMALVAGLMTVAFAGVQAGEDAMKKSDTGAAKSEKGQAKKDEKSKAGEAKKDEKKKDDKSTAPK